MPKIKKRDRYGIPDWLPEDVSLDDVPIELLCHRGLRGDSRVLLVLMARTEACSTLTIAQARELLHCGHDRAQRALRDLEDFGYLERETPFGARSIVAGVGA